MKTIKILIICIVFSAAAFYSCSDNDPIEKTPAVAQESIALRTALNEIKIYNNIAGRPAAAGKKVELASPFCFDLVYPITLSLTNGTNITINNFEGLIDVLLNESTAVYVSGIVFPFQVMHSGTVSTVSSESDFTALLQSCGFDTFNDDLLNTLCFEIVFPIQIGNGDEIIIIDSLTELQQYIGEPGTVNGLNIAFPISVIYNNQTVVIHNLYEFYQMVNNCDDCICSAEYVPVCVQTPVGIVEYGNMCFAMCAGFDQNDLVSCNPQTDCNISNVQATVGECTALGYQLTINFAYANPDAETFTIHNSANVLVGTYNLNALPLTINDYPNNLANATDFLTINIGPNCSDSVQWILPNCSCPCPGNVDPVCVWNGTELVSYNNACLAMCAGYTESDFITCGVAPNNFGTQLGSCFFMQYPVYVQHQGALVEINSDGELLQYWFPAMGPMPLMVYPITVTFGNTIYTFGSQAEFQSQINISCN